MMTRRGIYGWCVFDWANSAFNTIIGTFVFSVYFARGIYGDETAGSAVWGYALGAAGVSVAMLSPVLGAVADRGGARKPWLASFVLLTLAATALLWFATPEKSMVVYALACVIVATIAFELANVFYNSMLEGVAPPGMIGRISGWAWGLGYAGGLVCLTLALVGFIQPEKPLFGLSKEDAENVRATVLLVVFWFGLFSLPLFILTPDRPSNGLSLGKAVSGGLVKLGQTLRNVRHYGQIVRFLIASAFYRDGLATLFAMGGLYAAGTFGMDFEEILVFAIGLNVTAGIGAIGFAWLDDRLGSKPTVLVSLIGLIGFGTATLLISDKTVFIALALGLGIFVGPAQAASRSLMARLSPAEMETEMFGLYAFAGKSVAFMGPIAFGLATDAFDSQRAGMGTIILFFLVGGLILLTVREPRGGSDQG